MNTNSAAVSAIATVIAALIAAAALISAAADSARRSRPMMSAEFRIGPNSSTTILFVLKNYGASQAEAVSISFDPPLDDDDSTSLVRERYAKAIAVMNPGQEMVNSWYIPKFEADTHVGNHYTFPDEVTVAVTYRSGWRTFKSVIPLDVASYLNTSDTVSSASMLGSIRSIRDSLKKMAAK
ncbi:hypothetical protein [Plantibacter sp. YIM 135347]|uniref:hypothetical protein n=1 Tax=Plantibacter sp. YIM 135347 TaxID=3423919 RepID=UPI003D347EF8